MAFKISPLIGQTETAKLAIETFREKVKNLKSKSSKSSKGSKLFKKLKRKTDDDRAIDEIDAVFGQGPNFCTKFDPLNYLYFTAIFISFESIGMLKYASIRFFNYGTKICLMGNCKYGFLLILVGDV